MTVDPDVYVVLDEKLFLFSNADARTAFENEEPGTEVPAAQTSQLERPPAALKSPASHSTHALADAAPEPELRLPGGQALHLWGESTPVALENKPGAHARHAVAEDAPCLVPYLPAEHPTHAVRVGLA